MGSALPCNTDSKKCKLHEETCKQISENCSCCSYLITCAIWKNMNGTIIHLCHCLNFQVIAKYLNHKTWNVSWESCVQQNIFIQMQVYPIKARRNSCPTRKNILTPCCKQFTTVTRRQTLSPHEKNASFCIPYPFASFCNTLRSSLWQIVRNDLFLFPMKRKTTIILHYEPSTFVESQS